MRCIQGSDAHRLEKDRHQPKSLGIGDRVTEILLEEMSFEALAKVIKGKDLALTRPYRGPASPVDFVQSAREEGESLVQSFHASLAQRGGHINRILEDICAMANTNGGAIFAGVPADPKEIGAGVRDPQKAIERLQAEISNRITPEPQIHADILVTKGKQVVRITVQPGRDVPYAIDDSKFYVRDEAESSLAVRDEIVRLVKKGLQYESLERRDTAPSQPTPSPAASESRRSREMPAAASAAIQPPRTGVEVVSSEKRKGVMYHTVRDLRNGNLIKNVTKSSARKLWHYAISQVESGQIKPETLNWQDNVALISRRKKDEHVWYDLALREGEEIHYYYGVTDQGLNDAWLALIEKSANS